MALIQARSSVQSHGRILWNACSWLFTSWRPSCVHWQVVLELQIDTTFLVFRRKPRQTGCRLQKIFGTLSAGNRSGWSACRDGWFLMDAPSLALRFHFVLTDACSSTHAPKESKQHRSYVGMESRQNRIGQLAVAAEIRNTIRGGSRVIMYMYMYLCIFMHRYRGT